MVSAIACFGTTVAIPAAIAQAAAAPAARPMQLIAVGAAAIHISTVANQLATTSTITIGVSAHSLPTITAQRAIGRDHRYVPVRSSMSSPIDDATSIADSSATISRHSTNMSL